MASAGAGATRRNERALYGEAQSGGHCQMHALNAYLGRKAYDPGSFAALTRDYDVAAGQPPGTSNVNGPAGFFGFLHSPKKAPGPDPKTLFHFALARAGDPFDEAFTVSDESQSPAQVGRLRFSGRRGTDRGARPPGAWTRPRLDPARLARQGVRAVFVFNPGHVWIWRYGRTAPSSEPAWHKIDSMRGGGRPTPGDPSGEWNGPHGIGVAVPRSFAAGE